MSINKKVYIISYYNLKEKLAGGLRANELFKYLKKQKLDVEIITRKKSEGYETIITDFTISKKIRRVFHLVFPDSSITWVLKLYNYFKDKEDVVLIVTTPPHGLLYLSFLLRKKKTIKFIQDFRDPFTLSAHPQKNILLRKFFNKKIEKFMTKNTDYVIFNTDEHKSIFLNEYKNNFNYEVIKNGYIYENFDRRNTNKKLVYFGGHYGGKIVDVLLKFLIALNSKSNNNYVLDIYGEYHANYDKYKTVFNYCGFKNRLDLRNLLLDYKVGIVCYTGHYHGRGVATKFYEILGLGITPYCINPSNDLINLMDELNFGGYCYEDNLVEMDISFFDDFIPLELNNETLDKIKEYSRENQNNLFLEVIENV